MEKGSKEAQGREQAKTLFSDQTGVNYWESVYTRSDFLGDCYRQRMNQALSWLDAVSLPSSASILYGGCGAGVVTCEIAKKGYQVYATDYSRGMLDRANALCNTNEKLNVRFLQGDIEHLPFKDSSFEAVICLGVITYLRSEKKALRELSRILKPDGMLILSIVNRAYLLHYIDLAHFVKTLLQKLFARRGVSSGDKGREEAGSPPRSYFIPRLRESLRKQGLKTLDYKTVPLGLVKFFGHEIPPRKLNIKLALSLEKISNIPLVGSLWGMCVFRAMKLKSPELRENLTASDKSRRN